MSYELCYTSVPAGLRAGTRGFCTVGLTAGTPAALVEALESLSGYRPLFPAGSPRAAANPVSWSHWRVSAGGQTYSVLSRVCFSGLDYTKRSNKFAHHVALTNREQPTGGPAWLMAAGGIMRADWSGPPVEWPTGPAVPDGDPPAGPCAAWADACGDAGWAGVLAQADAHRSVKPVYVIYPPGLDVLSLVREALSLLPPAVRWQTTFNTYFTDLPAGSTCAWRFVADGSPAAAEVRRGALIDLTARLPEAPDGPLVRAAREGPSDTGESSWTLQSNADDDADLMPMAPRGSAAVANPRRTSAAPTASALPGDTASWMPPSSATVVSRPPARAKVASPLMLAVAGTVGALAASAGWYAAYHRQAAQVQKANDGVVTLQAQADASDVDARAARAQLDALARSHANELSAQVAAARTEAMKTPDPTVWQLIPSAADPAAKQFTQIDLDRTVRETIAGERKRIGGAATTAVATGIEEPSGLPLKQPLVAVPVEITGTGNRYFDIDRLPVPEAGKEVQVPIAVISDAGADLQMSLEILEDGDRTKCFYDRATHALLRDKKGAAGQDQLGQFVTEKSTVVLRWPAAKNDADRRDFLRRSLLVITDGRQRVAIQFVEPQSLAFTLRDTPAVPLTRLPPAGGRELVFATPPDAAWRQTGIDSTGATQFTSSPVGPVVGFRIDTDRLGSDFNELWTKAAADLAERTKARDELAAQLPKKEGTKIVDVDRLKDAQLKGLVDRFQTLTEAAAAASDQIKNLDHFPAMTAVVRLKNGVVTHRIDIRPGNAPAKH